MINMVNDMAERQNSIINSFQSLFEEQELLSKVIEFFPYPIQVYAPDGTSVLVNQALLDEYNVTDASLIVGKYNVFKDPSVIKTGQINALKRAFQGETMYFSDVRVPLEDIAERYEIDDFDVEAIYQDITIFPILDDMKKVAFVTAFLVNRRVYRGKDEIMKAKRYIEDHWQEKFDAAKTAAAACLSRAHFTKLFKKQTGQTPHEYYINFKIDKLKEKLLDTNLSVCQAFAACNLEYNGNYARLFRKITGLSPSDYRKMSG